MVSLVCSEHVERCNTAQVQLKESKLDTQEELMLQFKSKDRKWQGTSLVANLGCQLDIPGKRSFPREPAWPLGVSVGAFS